MKKLLVQKTIVLFLLLVTFAGCHKTEADVLGIVSTDEAHNNNHGTVVEVSYSDNTKMYFHLLTDTTAEVVNYQWFYNSRTDPSLWVYRGDIVVPQKFVHQGKNYIVNCIGKRAFYQSVGWNQGYDYDINLISSVVLPNTIDTIREGAFSGCCYITSFNIPNSVKYIGWSAFSGTNLSAIELSDAIDVIPGGLFSGCYTLTSVKMPKHVVGIGDEAFYATGFTSFEIPETVQWLGMDILYDCDHLRTIYCRPTTPPAKRPNDFEDYIRICENLEAIYVPSQSVELYKSDPAWRLYKDIIVGMD